MDFSKTYLLENDRVRLEPLNANHIPLLKSIAEEPFIWTYFLGRSNGKEDFSAYVNDAISYRKKEKEYPFAVYDKKKREYAGSTRLFDFDEELKCIRIGYTWYGKSFRRTGVNKGCKNLLFEFIFEYLKLERVGLGAHAENKISIAAMKSVGCKKEGELRHLFPSIKGKGRANAVLMSVLKHEWIEQKLINNIL